MSKLLKCKKHTQDLFYIIKNDTGTFTVMCQLCFDERVSKKEITFHTPLPTDEEADKP